MVRGARGRGLEEERRRALGRKKTRSPPFFQSLANFHLPLPNSHPQALESGLAVRPDSQNELGQEAHPGAHERRGHAGGDVDVVAGHFFSFVVAVADFRFDREEKFCRKHSLFRRRKEKKRKLAPLSLFLSSLSMRSVAAQTASSSRSSSSLTSGCLDACRRSMSSRLTARALATTLRNRLTVTAAGAQSSASISSTATRTPILSSASSPLRFGSFGSSNR